MKIIKFETDSCMPCKMVDSLLNEKEVEVTKYNVTTNEDKVEEFSIQSVPVTILLDETGEEIQRSIGFKPQELEDIISKL